MTSTIRTAAARTVLGLVLVLGVVVGLGAPARAQTIPTGITLTVTPTTLTVTDNDIAAQRTVQVSVGNLQPGSSFSIDVVSGTSVIGTITGTATADGTYDQPYVLPVTTPAGPVAFNLTGTGTTGSPGTANAGIIVIRLGAAVLGGNQGTSTTTASGRVVDGVQSGVGIGGATAGQGGGVSGTLARTGADLVIPAAILGACLLGLGGVALRGGRRRRRSSAAA